MVSTGLITSVGYDSTHSEFRILWQVSTPSTWGASSEHRKNDGEIDRDKEIEDLTYPQLISFSTRPQEELHSFLLAIGDSAISVLDHHGSLQHVEQLVHASVQPAVIADFNSDGIQDVIITTKEGYYGYMMRTHSGTSVLSVLVLSMLMILCVLYISTFIDLKDDSVQKNPELKQH